MADFFNCVAVSVLWNSYVLTLQASCISFAVVCAIAFLVLRNRWATVESYIVVICDVNPVTVPFVNCMSRSCRFVTLGFCIVHT